MMEQLTNEQIDMLQSQWASAFGISEELFDQLCRQAKSANAPILTRLDLIGELTSPEYISRLRGVMGPEVAWQPIETAPKDGLIDIWISRKDEPGVRWADCYYDSICDQWRTSRPSGHLITVTARSVTHWMPPPASPVAGEVKG